MGTIKYIVPYRLKRHDILDTAEAGGQLHDGSEGITPGNGCG